MQPPQLLPTPLGDSPATDEAAEQPARPDPAGPMVYVDAICPQCEQRGLRLPWPDGRAVAPVCPHCGSPVQMGDS